MSEDLGKKLEVTLKVLSLSRAGLASAIGVDKSVAGRWVSGKVKPSAHNLGKISQLVAETVSGFTMLDWERSFEDFSRVIGASAPNASYGEGTLWQLLSPELAEEARAQATQGLEAFEGIWKFMRPSSDLPNYFMYDVVKISRRADGFLSFISGVQRFKFSGTAIKMGGQLYYFSSDDSFSAVNMGIINVPSGAKAEVMDGVFISTLRDAGSSPVASGVVLERVADLTGDDAVDQAKFEEEIAKQELVLGPDEADPEYAKHLHETANAPGLLRMLFILSKARASET